MINIFHLVMTIYFNILFIKTMSLFQLILAFYFHIRYNLSTFKIKRLKINFKAFIYYPFIYLYQFCMIFYLNVTQQILCYFVKILIIVDNAMFMHFRYTFLAYLFILFILFMQMVGVFLHCDLTSTLQIQGECIILYHHIIIIILTLHYIYVIITTLYLYYDLLYYYHNIITI